MRLDRLTVQEFRNLRAATLAPAPRLTVLCGPNGQGKTNLLESIWLLTGGKSFRGAKDAELIRRGQEFAVVEGAFEAGGRPQAMRLTVGSKESGRPGRPRARLNGADRGRAASVAGDLYRRRVRPHPPEPLSKAGRTDGGIFWMRRCASCTPATWRRCAAPRA